jgi:flavin reductase
MDPFAPRNDFRNAMARVCAPMNIVTTDGPAGRGGFTAAAMCSVSDDPPTLLVCMDARSTQSEMFLRNASFCANVLTDEHVRRAGKFAGSLQNMSERYAAAEWLAMPSGTLALVDAIVSFECRIEAVHPIGHTPGDDLPGSGHSTTERRRCTRLSGSQLSIRSFPSRQFRGMTAAPRSPCYSILSIRVSSRSSRRFRLAAPYRISRSL